MFERLVSYETQHNLTTWSLYRIEAMLDLRVTIFKFHRICLESIREHIGCNVPETRYVQKATRINASPQNVGRRSENLKGGLKLNEKITVTTNFPQIKSNVLNRLDLLGMCMKNDGLRCIIDLWCIRNSTNQHKYHPLTLMKIMVVILAHGLRDNELNTIRANYWKNEWNFSKYHPSCMGGKVKKISRRR